MAIISILSTASIVQGSHPDKTYSSIGKGADDDVRGEGSRVSMKKSTASSRWDEKYCRPRVSCTGYSLFFEITFRIKISSRFRDISVAWKKYIISSSGCQGSVRTENTEAHQDCLERSFFYLSLYEVMPTSIRQNHEPDNAHHHPAYLLL